MLVEQVIFTSVRSGRNEGYQIAACSSGVTAAQTRELVQWGPSHDSLYGSLPQAESISHHALTDGSHCVSHTVLAGREYSGRGGKRVYTQMFLVSASLFARFGNSPFRVFESLLASGRVGVLDQLPATLEPLPLLGRNQAVNAANLEQVVTKIGAHRLASLLTATLSTPRLGVTANISGTRLFRALLDLLPPSQRADLSLTTGLKVCAARDYRLMILPADAEEQRRAIRQVRLEVLDLTGDPPTRFAPRRGWPQWIHQLLKTARYDTLAEIVESCLPQRLSDLDLIAEQQRERWENDHTSALMTF